MNDIALRARAPGRLAAAATFLGIGMGLGKARTQDDKPKDGKAAEGEEKDAEEKDTTAQDDAGKNGDDKDQKGKEGANEDGDKGKDTTAEDGECDCDPEDPECDCDEAEMRGDTPQARARARERARCAAIFAHRNAAANPDFAARIAFTTTLPRAEALALMEAAPPAGAAGATGLAARMAAQAQPDLGPGGQPAGGAKAQAGAWDAAIGRVTSR